MKKYLIVFFIFLSSLAVPVFSQNSANTARIAFLDFYDNTKTSDYGYLPGSIRDAILQSMQKKFEFEEVSPDLIAQYFPDSELEKRNDNRYIKKIKTQLNADIIIFGEFSYDENSQLMTISPKIYFALIDEMAELKKISNPVDSTLFQVTEKVSDNIVDEINRMIEISSKKSGTEVTVVDDKKVIDKKSMETRAMVWAVGLSGQVIYNPGLNSFVGFAGLSGEQYFNPWLSGYGSLSYGYSDAGISYIKVPSVGFIALVTALAAALGGSGDGFSLLASVPGILAMDGFAANIKIGSKYQIAPYLGLVVALPLDAPVLTDSIFGAEGGVRFNIYASNKIRISIHAGAYFTFANVLTTVTGDDFALNSGFSVSYLTGK